MIQEPPPPKSQSWDPTSDNKSIPNSDGQRVILSETNKVEMFLLGVDWPKTYLGREDMLKMIISGFFIKNTYSTLQKQLLHTVKPVCTGHNNTMVAIF